MRRPAAARAAAAASRSDGSCCVGCQRLIEGEVRALECEGCGGTDSVSKCSECFSMND